ncbi:hypothetical protein Tco_1411929 [Tanacetum coccineum]
MNHVLLSITMLLRVATLDMFLILNSVGEGRSGITSVLAKINNSMCLGRDPEAIIFYVSFSFGPVTSSTSFRIKRLNGVGEKVPSDYETADSPVLRALFFLGFAKLSFPPRLV